MTLIHAARYSGAETLARQHEALNIEHILPVRDGQEQDPCPWARAVAACYGRLIVTEHAIERWRERAPTGALARGSEIQIHRRIVGAVQRAVLWRSNIQQSTWHTRKRDDDSAFWFDMHDAKTDLVCRVVHHPEMARLWVVSVLEMLRSVCNPTVSAW